MPGFKQSQHGWQFWDSAKDGQCLWSPIWCVSQSIPVTVVNYKPVPNHSLPSLILLVAKIGLQEKKTQILVSTHHLWIISLEKPIDVDLCINLPKGRCQDIMDLRRTLRGKTKWRKKEFPGTDSCHKFVNTGSTLLDTLVLKYTLDL